MDSDDFPYSSPKILDCERICRGINKERKKEFFILFPKEERGQMHRVLLIPKGEGLSLLLSFKGQGRDSLVSQLVKNLPAMQETSVRFLGQEDPLEKG